MASGRGAIEKLILLGDKGKSARHVPEARHKAIEFAKQVTPGAYLSKKLYFRDGWASIQVTQGRRRIIIYTEAGEATYEFFTSELIKPSTPGGMGTPPHVGTGGYNLSVCGKGSFHEMRQGRSTALVNLCSGCTDTLPGDPPEEPWPLEDCDTNEGLIFMKTPEAWDFKKAPLHVWWSNNQGNEFIIVQPDIDPYYSRRCLQARFNGSFINRDFQFSSDGSYYPVAYTYKSGEPFAYGSPDMPVGRKRRKACIVNSQGFKIIVMVDNKGTFYAWEAGKYDTAAEIPRVETVTPSYDVRIEDALGTFNFNSDGSRAVAVGLERFQSPLDSDSNTVYKATVASLEGHAFGYGRDNVSYPNGRHLAKEDSPHLVEVNISVGKDSISGEWTFGVSIRRSERYGDTGQWFIAADYLIGDDRLPYPKDTLVALTFQMQYDNSDSFGLWFDGVNQHFPDDIHVPIDTSLSTEAYIEPVDAPAYWQEIKQYPMYGNVRVVASNISPFTDPYGNEAETWDSRQTETGGGAYKPLYSGVIRSMNLRTLSFLFLKEEVRNNTTLSSNNARSFQTQVHAYGEVVDTQQVVDSSQGAPTFDFAWPVVDRSPVPANYLALLSVYAENLFQSEWLNQFHWHPKGHWSINHPLYPNPNFDLANWQVDIVNTRIGKTDKRTTHKDLYNAAFGDTRDYIYYNDDTNYKGVFRTAGLWRDR